MKYSPNNRVFGGVNWIKIITIFIKNTADVYKKFKLNQNDIHLEKIIKISDNDCYFIIRLSYNAVRILTKNEN